MATSLSPPRDADVALSQRPLLLPGRAIMHRFAKRLFVLALVMVIHIVPSAAFADRLVDGVPIPDDAKIVPPSPPLPASQHRFLGALVGRRARALNHILIS